MILLVGGEKWGEWQELPGTKSGGLPQIPIQGEVLLVDCDPQRTTSDWIQERK